jgi:hypothetical protein
MIDLAISIGDDENGTTVIETNHGDHVASPNWPQDSDFRLVAFTPGAKKCDVIRPEILARDIALAVQVLKKVPETAREQPDWYRRLLEYSVGTGNI